MRIIGCDLHARQQTLAMLDTVTGEVVKTTLQHEGNTSFGTPALAVTKSAEKCLCASKRSIDHHHPLFTFALDRLCQTTRDSASAAVSVRQSTKARGLSPDIRG
jgi:hypothetical protein